MTCEPGETVGAFLCQAGQMLRAAAISVFYAVALFLSVSLIGLWAFLV